MKNFRLPKLKKKYWILLGVAAAAVLLLGISAAGYFRSSSYASGTVAAIVILFLILLAVLVALIVLVAYDRKNGQTVTAQNVTLEQSGPQASAKEEKGEGKKRFDGLSRIDERKMSYRRKEYAEGLTLQEICEEFRAYAAGRLKLYYEEEDIRRFIAGLAVSHILILQGMSGTGKTSLAYAFGEYLGNPSTVVPVQPMWKERTDLVGYYNEFTKRFNETDLLKKMYEANYSEEMYITVLDEMNIARVEYYFAEFLSLLELPKAEERKLTVVSDSLKDDPEQLEEGHIQLPENMWFIGTANNDDSTFAISDKVYDRAMVLDLERKSEEFIAGEAKERHIRSKDFQRLAEEAEKEYGLTERNRRRLEELDEYMSEKFRVTFGNRIRRQIEKYVAVYVSCGGKELEALDDILAKKVMRKLGMQNPVYLKNNAERLCLRMEELFGEESMPQCKEAVRRLAGNV